MAAMKRKGLLGRVEINPKVMLGKPVIRGTRISVEAILEKLAADIPITEVLEDYPRLTRADVLAAIEYARHAVGTDEIIPRAATSRR
jgi:uncharacterized protein (DUF433 family)